MKLIAPNGSRVSVSDEKGIRLLRQGYRTVDGKAPKPAPVPAEPVVEETNGDDLEPPRGNASREEWAAFAVSLGIEVSEDAKRDEIKVLVEELLADDESDE